MGKPDGYFTISDLAKALDVKKSHIRFCEEQGFISPRITKLKRRIYSMYDLERLKLIFHFVLLGYSKEHIADLIGMPDGNLDENDQLIHGIEYGEKKLKALEKQKKELGFTKKTNILSEIGMVHAYIKTLKNIRSGVIEKPKAKSISKFEERVKAATEQAPGPYVKAEKKSTQQPLRVISLFVGGLALVIIIGSYFYYQFGQKDTQTTKTMGKEAARSETFHVFQESEPLDQAVKTQTPAVETRKMPKVASKESATGVIQRNQTIQIESKPGLFESKESMEKQIEVVKDDTVSKEDDIIAGVAQHPSSPLVDKALPATEGVSLLPEEQKPVGLQDKGAPETDVTKEPSEESLEEKSLHAASGGETLWTAASETVKGKVAADPVKEDSDPESVVKASPAAQGDSLLPDKQKSVGLQDKAVPKMGGAKEPAEKSIKEKALSAASGEETLSARASGTVKEKMPETKVMKPSNGLEKGQVVSMENMGEQEDRLRRLKSFMSLYCRTYTNKDLDRFITFFTPDAIENGRPFHELVPEYRKNMESTESFDYRVEITSYTQQVDRKNIVMQGTFFSRYQLHGRGWEENSGSITMELLETGDSFLVRKLTY